MSDDWILVETFSTRMAAEVAKSALESAGIKSQILADDLGGMRPHLALTAGVKLLVQERDAETAQCILTADASEDSGLE